MDITIKVDEALSYMHLAKGKKITREDLADAVFADDRTSQSTRIHYLSRWSKGQAVDAMRVTHLLRMSEFTGLPMEELIEKY